MTSSAPRSTVESPCTSVCRMSTVHPWCEGCHRSLDEIATWSRMSSEQKRIVWAQLPARRMQTGAPPLDSGPT